MRAIGLHRTVAQPAVSTLICVALLTLVSASSARAQLESPRKVRGDIPGQTRGALASDPPMTDSGRGARESTARGDTTKTKRQTVPARAPSAAEAGRMAERRTRSTVEGTGSAAAIDPSSFGSVMGAGQPPSADQKMLMEFQQRMMAVAGKASNGDVVSRARLAAWQSIVVRHQGEIVAASHASTAGDRTAAQKLQQLQMKIIREWMNGGATHASTTKP